MAGSERREQVVRDATPLFQHFGFAKTTMADVARAAGVSRPTLYAEFPDKTTLFGLVIDTLATQTIAQIGEALSGEQRLRERLLLACRTWVQSGHDLVTANPDAADLFDPRFEAVQAANVAFERFVAEILPAQSEGVSGSLSAERMSRMISLSLQGFKRFTHTQEELDALIESLIDVVCLAY
jgi:AcrR family transcriptional regulator